MGGAGRDYIFSINGSWSSAYVTINAGTVNDTIYMDNYYGRNLLEFNCGDGNDIVYYLQSGNTLKISSARQALL